MLKTRKSELAYLLFKKAAEAWLETRRPFLSPRTFEDYEKHIETLALFFGELKLTEIGPDHLRAYQKMRMARAGGRKINQELGVIQQILKRIGRWQDVGFDYQTASRAQAIPRTRAIRPRVCPVVSRGTEPARMGDGVLVRGNHGKHNGGSERSLDTAPAGP